LVSESSDNLFPPKELIERFLLKVNADLQDTPFLQYYDTGVIGKLHRMVFRTRYEALHNFLARSSFQPKHVLDIGCGCMLIAFGLLKKYDLEYVGLDILPSDRLRKYAALVRKGTGRDLQVVRASAMSLPFRKDLFDLTLAFDILEHLEKPRNAITELVQISTTNGILAVSIPMEKLFHRVARILGNVMLGRPWRIGQKPSYHYATSDNHRNYRIVKTVHTPFNLAPVSINKVLFSRVPPHKSV
jgi:SAM-dependent methyltransferase